MKTMVSSINDQDFISEVLQNKLPVFVEFGADWCGPCYINAPMFEDLSEEYHGKVKFAKMNVDKNTVIPKQYGIQFLPTTMFFKNGEMKFQDIGVVEKEELQDIISKILNS